VKTLDLEKKIALTNLQARIIEHLCNGHKNAVGLKDLCKLTSTNERKLRLAIEALRNEGYLLVFGQKLRVKEDGKWIVLPAGYFFAATQQEANEFITYMRSRVIDECLIMRSIRLAAKKKFQREFGQIPLM